mmetsp:Transcript_13615/g.19518  ORF Transcript_13615/g.19518 Transcript_13615/m.19518 type:complete len:171 (+) Transcript_13615:131-643(+)
MALVVSPEYGYCIAIAVATGFHYTMQTVGVAKARYSAMSREYFEKHFAAENEAHKKEFGKPIAVGGHPDNGLGRLSSKLDFISWIKLQNAQRVHLNYLEGLTPAIANLLLAGLFYPITSASLGVLNLVGRQLYASGYRAKGPDGRLYGFLLINIAQVSFTGMGIFGGRFV